MKKVKLLLFVLVSGVYVCLGQDIKEVNYANIKNIVSFNYGDLIADRVAISYERLLLKGKLGLKLPLAVAYTYNNYYTDKSKMQIGLDVNYYPLGQKRLTYYTGIGSKVGRRGVGYGYCPTCEYYPGLYYDYIYYSPKEVTFFSAQVNNGLQFTFNKHFSISGQFGIGVITNTNLDSYYNYYGEVESNFSGELNASFRF